MSVPMSAQKIVDSNADLEVKKSEAAQRQQNAAIATDVAVRQQQVYIRVPSTDTLNTRRPCHTVLACCARFQHFESACSVRLHGSLLVSSVNPASPSRLQAELETALAKKEALQRMEVLRATQLAEASVAAEAQVGAHDEN